MLTLQDLLEVENRLRTAELDLKKKSSVKYKIIGRNRKNAGCMDLKVQGKIYLSHHFLKI